MLITKINIQHERKEYSNVYIRKDILWSILCKKFLQFNKKMTDKNQDLLIYKQMAIYKWKYST